MSKTQPNRHPRSKWSHVDVLGLDVLGCQGSFSPTDIPGRVVRADGSCVIVLRAKRSLCDCPGSASEGALVVVSRVRNRPVEVLPGQGLATKLPIVGHILRVVYFC